MPELGRYSRELRARLWKPSVTDEVSDEIRAHLEQLEQDLVASGYSPDAARAEARRKFGNLAGIEAECRDIGERRDEEFRRQRWFDEMRQDVRQALRQLRLSPRFAFAAIATLATGLGASTTIFSLANAVLFRPLPYTQSDRLLLVNEVTPEGKTFSVSEPNYLDWVGRSRSFASWAAYAGRTVTLTGDGEPEQLQGVMATHALFATLGVTPVRGRAFLAEEDVAGGDTRVALISQSLWERRYGMDPATIGRTIDIDGSAHRVVGVIPQGHTFPEDVDVWTPLSPSLEYPRGDRRLDVIARLRDGVTREQAGAEMTSIAEELRQRYPVENEKWSAAVTPFRQAFVSPQFEMRVLALLATVVLLLAMACINVGNLLLARAAARSREIAVRAALGAGTGRLVRQLLTEATVLALAGALVGTLMAMAAVPVLKRMAGDSVPRLDDVSMDWRVLAFALAASLASALFFGVASAWRLGRSGDSIGTLKSGTRLAPAGRTRNGLIVASVALATILLVSAALVGTSFLRLMGSDLGYDPSGVTIANVSTENSRYDSERSVEFMRTLINGVATAPGVEAVGAIVTPPFGALNYAQGFIRAELANPTRDGYRMGSWRVVTPGYFEAVRIPVIRGRVFTDADRESTDISVVINETLAQQAFGTENPVGQRLASSNGQVKTVIGVVRDTRHVYLDSLPNPTMYWAHAQFPAPSMWLAVRGRGDVVATLRAQVKALDPLLPVASVQPLSALVADRAAEARLTMLVFMIFAGAALVLAAVGLYGVIAYTVSQRTREIGVTLALGERPSRVIARIVGNGVKLSTVGVALGLVAAVAVTTVLRSILYETQATDMVTYAGVALLLVLIGALASAGPARRASRLDPVTALRSE